jgi:hypothetical protein
MDELLPLHHDAKGDGVYGVEGETMSGSGACPLPSLQSSHPFCAFHVSLLPHRDIAMGYILLVLGQDKSVE